MANSANMASTSKHADSVASSEEIADFPYSLLEVRNITSEPIGFSESGGGLDEENKKRNRAAQRYTCTFCSTIYKSEAFFKKHVKKHTAKKGTSVRSETKHHYQCPECRDLYSTLSKLYSHEKIHRKFICEYCDEKCSTKNGLEYHTAICLGKIGAFEGGRRPFTRSQRTANYVSVPESDEELDSDDELVNCDRDREICNWISGLRSTAPSERCEVNSLYTSFTRASSRYNDFTDGESQFSFVSRSTQTNTKTSTRTSIRKKKRLQKTKNIGICSEAGCRYQCGNKKLLMLHEKIIHNIEPTYRCNVCRSFFTKRTHYQQHLPTENIRRFFCNICHKFFIDGFITEHEYLKHLCSEEHFQRKLEGRESKIIERVSYGKETGIIKSHHKYRAINKGMLLMDELRPNKTNVPDFAMMRFLDKDANKHNMCVNQNAPYIIRRNNIKHNVNL